MAYNISEVSGTFTDGVDTWTTTADLNDPSVDIISGDFDQVTLGGANQGEAAGGYTFGVTAGAAFGTLTFNTTDGTFSFDIDRAAVIASGTDQTVVIEVIGSDGAGNADDDRAVIEILICVETGTLIDTPDGAREVQTLLAGDLVCKIDGEAVPLRWSGSRAVSAAEIANDPSLGPVRIDAGALGAGRPEQALVVSAQHRVMIDGPDVELMFGVPEVLVPAIALTGWPGIEPEGPRNVTYAHLLFDAHQVIMTNGAPSESFYPGEWSFRAIGDAARAEILAAVPDAVDAKRYGPTARPAIKTWEARALQPAGRRAA